MPPEREPLIQKSKKWGVYTTERRRSQPPYRCPQSPTVQPSPSPPSSPTKLVAAAQKKETRSTPPTGVVAAPHQSQGHRCWRRREPLRRRRRRVAGMNRRLCKTRALMHSTLNAQTRPFNTSRKTIHWTQEPGRLTLWGRQSVEPGILNVQRWMQQIQHSTHLAQGPF